jgi:acetoin:2,6-dichlorophenolindophenol oxidoreductase subunit alpha
MVIKYEDLMAMYEFMVLSRILEKELSEVVPYWHACDGEEASLVGTFFNLRKDDYISAHYRGVSLVYYMRGADLRRIIAGHIGKDTSYTRGRIASKTGPIQINALGKFSGSLGTNWNMAVGAALAMKLKKTTQVVVVNFGDGSSSRGDFHEAINFAGVQSLPIVFVCQNNQYGSSLPFSKATAARSIADRAIGYGIPGQEVDGNDVIKVYQTVNAAVERARSGKGPTLIEAQTYRIGGHNVADKENYRSKEEVNEWRKKEPIENFKNKLIKAGILTAKIDTEIWANALNRVNEASKAAQNDPWPSPEVLEIGGVFAPS